MEAKQHSILFSREDGSVSHDYRDIPVLNERGFDHIVESHVIGLYPSFTFQTVEGFGCAMTETACFLLSGMAPEERKKTLSLWFGPEEGKARFIRIPIDSCDYSLSEYQAVEDPVADPEFKTFSIDRDRKYILPVVKEALALSNGRLSVLMSPWSPPWQWKTPPLKQGNDASAYGGQETAQDGQPSRNNGGSLKPEFYGSWAKYLVMYIQAYLAEGVPVTMLSVQNEAAAATPWDSCVWTGVQEKTFLKDHLVPAMKEAGLPEKVQIFVWDHNKERMIEHIEEIMTPDTAPLIDGFAYHWYTGDHFDALAMLHGKYPDKILMHSESCPLHRPGWISAVDLDIEELKKRPAASLSPDELAVLIQSGDKTPADVDLEDAFSYAHDMIGDLNHGMQRWIDWNLIVDQNGGPRHVDGGFAAPLFLNASGEVVQTVAYAYLNLIMNAIPAGSVRIGCSAFAPSVEITAVRTPQNRIGILLYHPAKEKELVHIRIAGQVISVTLPPESLTEVAIST